MANKGAYTLCEWLVGCDNETVLYVFTDTGLSLLKNGASSGDHLDISYSHRDAVKWTRMCCFILRHKIFCSLMSNTKVCRVSYELR